MPDAWHLIHARDWMQDAMRIARVYGAFCRAGEDPLDLPLDLFDELTAGEDSDEARQQRSLDQMTRRLGGDIEDDDG